MRILFLSNYYPPFSHGGYEQWCQEVAESLNRQGHQVFVLTSRAPDGKPAIGDELLPVYHTLNLEVEKGLIQTIYRSLFTYRKLEAENLKLVRRLIEDIQPDVALIWGMWNMPRSVPALVEKLLPGRVAYYICDYWLALPSAYIQRWKTPSRRSIMRFPKWLMRKLFLPRHEKEKSIPLDLEHPICVSRAVRGLLIKSGAPIDHAEVIYGGTRVEEFSVISNRSSVKENEIMKLLYVGRIIADKGIHTAIEAISLLLENSILPIKFDLYGSGDVDYLVTLNGLIRREGLEQIIAIRESVPRSQIPTLMGDYDVLLFPSAWEEPFARTVLEAMAAGLVVIGTTTGGTGEVLIEGETGLTFLAGDARFLANQIQRLYSDPELRTKLAKAGQQDVMEKFTLSRMVNQLEATLQDIHNKSTSANQRTFRR